MKLTDIKCKNAKPKADKPYKLFDGGGLYLEILPTGKKLWRLKYYFLGKEKRISLGVYPMVSLAEAREEREKAKKHLLKNHDPSAIRQGQKAELSRNAQNTFKAIAMEWLENGKESWSAGYLDKLEKRLELHVYPYLGARPIAEITPQELLNDCLRRIELRRMALTIWRAGCAKPADRYSAMRYEARLFERTRRAVWLSLYTFCRPREIRMARWEDIDLDEKLWIIPAAMMKMRRDHVVPLCPQAIAILKAQHEEVKVLKTSLVIYSAKCMSFQ